ncbi:competence protein ComEC [Halobacillus alkaliphilus]|uniref:Competence protein ComEC n=1 Tax=Halobacillus alkaliphilus TaxID=396056 RepID=A0A1I2JGY4_9BACI|nr:DNA internalization-related competence protein ComEC/Rec2 [Halobacillus alkaliphilus]SFF53250.1 competence protein ComEC [Halobacillus alkaliphilus]
MIGKGRWHIPVTAFVLGGVLVRLSGMPFWLLGSIVIGWIFFIRKSWPYMVVLICFCLFGYYYLSPLTPASIKPGPTGLLSAIISSDVKETPQTIQMEVTLQDSQEKAMVILFNNQMEPGTRPHNWHHGAVCSLKGSIKEIDKATNPGQFNYQAFLANQEIYSQIEIEGTDGLSCNDRSILSYVYEWRKNLMGHVENVVDAQAYPWMAALIFGESKHLKESTIEWFRDFNLSHILAISGLHVGLTIGGLYFLIYRTGLGTIEQARLLVILMLPGYSFLAGAAPSVVRASLMAFLILIFRKINVKIPITDLLSLVAISLLLLSPGYFTNIGFQFSFLVTMSLIYSLPIIERSPFVVVQSAYISLISQLSILPIQLSYFYEFNPLSLFANLIIVPYFSFIVIPLLLLLFCVCLITPEIAFWLSKIIIYPHEKILHTLQSIGTPFNIQWTVGELEPLYIVLYLIAFGFMMKEWVKERLFRGFTAGSIAVCVLLFFSVLPYFSPSGKVTMLDIGQGDCFVVELPYRRGVMIVDAGGPPVFSKDKNKTVEQIITPYLKSRGIRSIDGIFVSHKDVDHSGSVQAMVETFRVSKLFVSDYYEADEKGVEIVRVSPEDRILIANHSFRVLHPKDDSGNPNNNSLVIWSEIGGLTWLFTGDISTENEEELMESYPGIQADVLKVAHHGSNTSSSEEWVKWLQPRINLISAGRENRYGHPHREVTQRLEEYGSLYVTKDHGAVQYTFSGSSGTFSTFLPYNASRE